MTNHYLMSESQYGGHISTLKAEIEKLKEQRKNKEDEISKLKREKAEELTKKDQEINGLTKQMEHMSQEFAEMLKVIYYAANT